MSCGGVAAVGVGAAAGAWLRWWLGTRRNAVLRTLPLGTLAANLLGGYLIGLALARIDRHASLPPELRLFVVTGFLGGLTTFATFSAEVASLQATSNSRGRRLRHPRFSPAPCCSQH